MNTGLSILTTLLLLGSSYAQVSKLAEFENKVSKQIQVGMTGEEVKKKIGRPKAVQGGFPNTDDRIIIELPEQAGQLNYSTWFYFFDIITITVPKDSDAKFFINKIEVSEGMYNDYKDLEEIYLVDSSIIFPAGKEHYQREDSSSFSIQRKSHKDTYILKPKVVNEKKKFVPIFSVLFDRGTQVVASTKFMFQLIQY